MGLFVCSNCKATENTNCVMNSIEYDEEMIKKQKEKGYPCLHLMDMHGFSNEANVLTDKQGEVRMLCCLCNTGIHHKEFDITIANEDEIALAKTSKYNMITPFDSKEIMSDDNARFGYSLKKNKIKLYHEDSSPCVSTRIDELNDELYVKASEHLIHLANLKRKIKAIKKAGESKSFEYTRLCEEYKILKGKRL